MAITTITSLLSSVFAMEHMWIAAIISGGISALPSLLGAVAVTAFKIGDVRKEIGKNLSSALLPSEREVESFLESNSWDSEESLPLTTRAMPPQRPGLWERIEALFSHGPDPAKDPWLLTDL
jgi:hypothetical protein